MQNMAKRNSIILLFIMLISSCGSKEFDTTEEIFAFISDEENGYCFKKEVNGVEYILQYRPTDIMIQQELVQKSDVFEVKKLRNKYNKNLYFNLSMSIDGKEILNTPTVDRNKYNQMVNDLVFNMPEKVALYTAEKDTLTMIDCVYPRMYGMSKSTTILLVFLREEEYLNKEYLYFTVQDLGLNTGEISFKIPSKQLNIEPKLNFKD